MAEQGYGNGKRYAIEGFCLLVACALAAIAMGNATAADGFGIASKRSPVVSVRGNATGLYPGASVPLRLEVRNRGSQPLVVTRIKVRAGAAGAACPGSVLSVRIPERGRLRLRARTSARATYSVRMLPSAPDSCQGARIPLRFKVRARRA